MEMYCRKFVVAGESSDSDFTARTLFAGQEAMDAVQALYAALEPLNPTSTGTQTNLEFFRKPHFHTGQYEFPTGAVMTDVSFQRAMDDRNVGFRVDAKLYGFAAGTDLEVAVRRTVVEQGFEKVPNP